MDSRLLTCIDVPTGLCSAWTIVDVHAHWFGNPLATIGRSAGYGGIEGVTGGQEIGDRERPAVAHASVRAEGCVCLPGGHCARRSCRALSSDSEVSLRRSVAGADHAHRGDGDGAVDVRHQG